MHLFIDNFVQNVVNCKILYTFFIINSDNNLPTPHTHNTTLFSRKKEKHSQYFKFTKVLTKLEMSL